MGAGDQVFSLGQQPNGKQFRGIGEVGGRPCLYRCLSTGSRSRLPGMVYVFRKAETGQWEPEVKLQPDDLVAYALFGSALDAIGDSVLIRAPSSVDSANYVHSGLAYWYQRDDTGTWNLEGRFQPYDGEIGDRFGRAVAMSSSLFVGAFGKDDHLLPNSGAAYAYENPNWNDTPPVLELEGTTISVEMDEDGDPVAWSAPSLSATDAGGDS